MMSIWHHSERVDRNGPIPAPCVLLLAAGFTGFHSLSLDKLPSVWWSLCVSCADLIHFTLPGNHDLFCCGTCKLNPFTCAHDLMGGKTQPGKKKKTTTGNICPSLVFFPESGFRLFRLRSSIKLVKQFQKFTLKKSLIVVIGSFS